MWNDLERLCEGQRTKRQSRHCAKNEAAFEEQAETAEENISSITTDLISLPKDSIDVEQVDEQFLEEQELNHLACEQAGSFRQRPCNDT